MKIKLTEICLWLCAAGALWTAWDVHQVNTNLEYLTQQEHLEKCEHGGNLWVKMLEKVVVETTKDKEFRGIMKASAISFVDEIAKAKTREIAEEQVANSGQTFLPQNFGEFLRLLAIANYSSTASVVSDWAHRTSLSLYQNFDFDDDDDYDPWWYEYQTNIGDAFEVASQAAKVVAKTRYLTNNTVQSDGSAIGNVLAALPGQINVALGDRYEMSNFAGDCITLAARFHQPDYKFCVKTAEEKRDKCYDYNEFMGEITNAVTDFCRVLQTSTYY